MKLDLLLTTLMSFAQPAVSNVYVDIGLKSLEFEKKLQETPSQNFVIVPPGNLALKQPETPASLV